MDPHCCQQALYCDKECVCSLKSELERLRKEVVEIRSAFNWESDSRLHAEGELNGTLERLQLAMEAAGLAMWDFQEPFKEVYLTARWGEILSDNARDGMWDIREVVSRVHEEDLRQVQAEWSRVLKGEVNRGCVRYRFRTSDGRWIWLETHGRVTERASDGRATRVTGTHADITERAAAEAPALKAKLQAAEASLPKSELLASISHDMRTPLNAIIGLNRLLLRTRIDEEQRQWLGLVSDSADALLGMLNDALDLSKIEAGNLSLNPVLVDFKEIVRNVFHSYVSQLDEKQVKWQIYIDPSVPTWLLIDPIRLRQILNKLLANAHKFTCVSKNVYFGIDAIEDGRGQIVRMRLTDSAIGIDPDRQVSTCDSLVQDKVSTERQFADGGLEVMMCARLVTMMGGTISVTGDAGQGSCLEICLPIQVPALENASMMQSVLTESSFADGVSEKTYNGLQILLVDDDPFSLLSIRQQLQNMGCFVHDAQDGESAVSKWERYRPDLVFISLQITGIDKLIASARVRNIKRYGAARPVPVLALFAAEVTGGYDATLDSVFSDRISKPVELAQIRTAMEKALGTVQGIASDAESKAESPSTNDSLAYQPDPLQGPTPVMAAHETLGLTEREMCLLVEGLIADLTKRFQRVSQACKEQDEATAGREIQNIISSLHFVRADRAIQISRGLDMARRANEWRLFGHMLLLLHEEISYVQTLMGDYLEKSVLNAS